VSVSTVIAILKKDVRSLPWLISLVALLFLADPVIVRLELLPVWTEYGAAVVFSAVFVLTASVFQLDSAASLTDDWLCRPVPKAALLVAKLLLLATVVYLPRAIGTLASDLFLGVPLAESALDAVLLQDRPLVLLLPIFIFIAIVTRTFVQAFGVQFAIFIAVFVLPTPFIRPPGPLTPGIRDGLLATGLHWLPTIPAHVASLGLLALGAWLVYWRHRVRAARILLSGTVLLATLLLALPMALLPWNFTFAIHAAVSPSLATDARRITLRNTKACFAAARRADAANDPRFGHWEDESVRDAGQNAVEFITALEARGLPLDWRALFNNVQADVLDGERPVYSLRPARYTPPNDGADALRHEWLLPEAAVRALRDTETRLRLTYSLTLVKPREFSVATDGAHHRLPGLGWCSARPDDSGTHIAVDCFVPGAHPAQLSAQLDEIPASRAFDRPDFSPRAAEWPYGRRARLTIPWARLAKHDTITVTAWDAAGQLRKSLTMPGILGADADTCPLPEVGGASFEASVWRDVAPHETRSIGVDEGVQLEVLDFGGDGAPILLLPGLGATAHSFDELAPRLARDHRVVAMTRRGTGASTAPDFGYDTPRLSQDVLRVLDAMKLDHVLLVGHSIAGDELTWLGARHDARFRGLVYLDAAYDRSQPRSQRSRFRELGALLPPEPPIPPSAYASYDAMSALLAQRGHLRTPEGELIAFWHANNPVLAGTPAITQRHQQAMLAAIGPPDYLSMKLPALAIFAMRGPDEPLPPWYDAKDASLKATLAEIGRVTDAKKRRDIETFRTQVEHGEVLEIPNAGHYIIQSNLEDVLGAIGKFDAGLLARQ
jgi:pimeloyl-ACP methyl ester carboxylesterase